MTLSAWIYSIDTTEANVHNILPVGNLLQGDEQRMFGDAGCSGIPQRNEHKDRKTTPMFIARRPRTRKKRKPKN